MMARIRRLLAIFSGSRPGVSLVEMLLFVALLAFSGIVIIDLLLIASDSQAQHRALSDVEQTGVQVAQLLGYQIRHAERIIKPAMQQSGSVLVLQMSDPNANPTVIGVTSGTLLMIEKTGESPVSDPLLRVSDFRVWNLSPNTSRSSVRVTFRITRDVAIPTMPTYSRVFDIAFSLFPDDEHSGAECGVTTCPQPWCSPGHPFWNWSVCNNGACGSSSGSLVCRP